MIRQTKWGHKKFCEANNKKIGQPQFLLDYKSKDVRLNFDKSTLNWNCGMGQMKWRFVQPMIESRSAPKYLESEVKLSKMIILQDISEKPMWGDEVKACALCSQ